MRKLLLVAIPVALVSAVVAASSVAAAGNWSSPNAAPTVQAGSTGSYGTLTPTRTTKPHAIAPGTAIAPNVAKPVLVRPALAAPTTKAPAASPARVETITKTSASGITASGLLITHDQEVAFPGGRSAAAPPDTQMAESGAWTFEVVNSLGEIRSRTSTAKTDFDMNAFFQLPTGIFFTDPRIIYDAPSARWYLSALSFDGAFDSIVGLAVSRSADPNGTWNIYTVLDHSSDRILCDQPHLGFSADKVTLACDEFNVAGAFQRDDLVTLDKTALVNGTTVASYHLQYPSGDTAHTSLQPAYSMTSTSTQYLTYIYSAASAGLIAITGNPANNNIAISDTTSSLAVHPFTAVPPRAPQSGTTATIDTGDIRFDNAVFENGTIWTGGGDICTPSGDTTARSCLRLIQFKTGNWPSSGSPTVGQDYDVGANGKYFFYPGIAMDASGTTYVAYSESSSTEFPSVFALDILGAFPGAVDTNVLVMAGAGAYTTGPLNTPLGGQRWGDYSGAAPDPNDAHTVLLSGELSAFEASHTDDWGTVAATFNIPGCATATIGTGATQPIYPGPHVIFTASATGCYVAAQFRFWKLAPGGTWTIVQDYSASNTYDWNTSTETTLGTYKFEVDARSFGSIAGYEATAATSFILASPATCTIGETFTPPSPGPTGTTVVIQASSNCPDPIYRFWIRAPGGPWTVVQAFSASSSYNWTSTSTPGTYGVEVDVKDRLDPAAAYGFPSNTTYTLQACTAADLAANPPSGTPPGGTVVITGSSSCPGTPVYQFWVRAPGGPWVVWQPFSVSNTFNWSTAGLAQGTYGLEVDVKNQGSTAVYEVVKSTSYRLAVAACATPTLSANPASPGPTGGPIVLTATTSGCPSPQYRFWVQSPAGVWTRVQDYRGTNTFSWAPSTGGGYRIEVDVRDQSEPTVSYDAVFSIPYQVKACSAVTLGTNPNSPQYPAGSVVLTGTATCPSTATYRFWTKAPGHAWTVARDYNTTSTFSWSIAGLATGSYALEVDVRDQNSTASYEAVANLTYVLQATPCNAPTLGASPTSPGPTGGTVTFTATTTSCTTPVFRFWVQAAGGRWVIMQNYSTTNTFSWTGTGHAGSYNIEVDVRDQVETTSYDAVANLTYLVNGCSAAALTANPASGGAHGTLITLTATSTCPGTATYRFWIKSPGGSWQVVQDYATGNTFAWTPATAGSYSLEVDVRDQGGTDSYEKIANITYNVT